MSPETVRDAMVPEPTTLAAGASAQDAGRSFAQSGEVRAIFVTGDDGRLLGVVTRKTLVREVVAAGLDPGAVTLREIMNLYGLEELEVSERDILHGAALAAAELPEPEEGAAPPGAYTCC